MAAPFPVGAGIVGAITSNLGLQEILFNDLAPAFKPTYSLIDMARGITSPPILITEDSGRAGPRKPLAWNLIGKYTSDFNRMDVKWTDRVHGTSRARARKGVSRSPGMLEPPLEQRGISQPLIIVTNVHTAA